MGLPGIFSFIWYHLIVRHLGGEMAWDEKSPEAENSFGTENSAVPPRLAAQKADGHSNSVTWKNRMVLPVRGRSNHELRSVALPLFAETGSQPVTRIFCRHARGAVSIIAFELWI